MRLVRFQRREPFAGVTWRQRSLQNCGRGFDSFRLCQSCGKPNSEASVCKTDLSGCDSRSALQTAAVSATSVTEAEVDEAAPCEGVRSGCEFHPSPHLPTSFSGRTAHL